MRRSRLSDRAGKSAAADKQSWMRRNSARHGHGNDAHPAWDTAFSIEGGKAMPALICMVAVIFAWAIATSHTALAQGTTIWTPGQPRTFVEPNGYGGATVFTPGQPRTFIDRTGDDSYTVFTPGQPRTFIQTAPRNALNPDR
jgi:hypothetical protein